MNPLSLTTLGRHIQALRTARGLSLSQLASDAGIAKSNLSRLEQGNGNPTIDTIWRLAKQLDIPFGSLVSPISEPVGEEGVLVRLIDQGHDSPKVDVYWMSCAPHTSRQAEAHTQGTRESITVISGQMETGTEREKRLVHPGETHHFAADQPHHYTTFEQWTTVMVTVVYNALDTDL